MPDENLKDESLTMKLIKGSEQVAREKNETI